MSVRWNDLLQSITRRLVFSCYLTCSFLCKWKHLCMGVCPVCLMQWHSTSWLIRIVSLSKCAVTWTPHMQSPAVPSTLSASPAETPDRPASLNGRMRLCCVCMMRVKVKDEEGTTKRERRRKMALVSYLPGGPSSSASGASASQVSAAHSWAMVMGPGWTLQGP